MPRMTSLAKIKSQIAKLEAQAKKLASRENPALKKVVALIKKNDLSLSDIRAAMKTPKKRRGPRKGTKASVKYRDDKGNKWSGRGRTPRWIMAAEKAGKKREAFLLK